VSIAKAIATDARLVILDEPTAALLPHEVDVLFAQMRKLAAQGHGFLYVSHRLAEIFDIADAATVLRDGRAVWRCADRAGLERGAVLDAIVGREGSRESDAVATLAHDAPVALEARALRGDGVRDATFALHAGEVLGLAGLPGSGAEETLDLLYGRRAQRGGELHVDGVARRFGSPRDAVAAGLALVPKNRLAEAALPAFSVRENVSLPALHRFVTDPLLRFVRRGAERRAVADVTQRLGVKTAGLDARMDSLSGGNQQKAVIARWVGAGARVYLLNSPTAAVDVGAKADIYRLLHELAAEGAAVLFTSTEMDEFPRLCHRVLVFRDGAIVAQLSGTEATETNILALAVGPGDPALARAAA
jgi:ABC-type sugar transport system ATPase subunit